VLGSGGFAAVYRCWQLRVGREVAVKVDNRVLLSERDRRRFVREVTAAGRLSGHPHVIDVYDAGTLPDGRPYLVMELCPAGSLADALHRDGPMSPAQVRDIGIRISDALAAAHARPGRGRRGRRAGPGQERVISKVQDCDQRSFSFPSGTGPTMEGSSKDRSAAEGADPHEHNLRPVHLGGTRAAAGAVALVWPGRPRRSRRPPRLWRR
jgi:hypothetical protein